MIQWFATNAKPLLSVAPSADTADLQPLKQILEGVRVVGLGEGSHGTREHFTMKHRLVEFLVKEMGYRTFAMEASYTAGLAVNEYLQTGEGDAKEVLRGLGFQIWDTEEVLALLKWLRAYNESVPSEQRVQFAGFDIQVVEPGALLLYQYLRAVHPDEVERFGRSLDELRLWSTMMRDEKTEVKEAHLHNLKALADLIEQGSERTDWAPVTRATALKVALNLYRYYDAYGVAADMTATGALRDAYMAETVRELLADLAPTSKVLLWAHNAHVADAEPWMGMHLRKQLGAAYYSLGLELHRGSSRLVPWESGRHIGGAKPVSLGEPPRESPQWVLHCAGLGNSTIDLRASTKSATVEAWNARERPFWWFGASIDQSPSAVPRYFVGRLTSFDGLIYIPESSPTRPNQ